MKFLDWLIGLFLGTKSYKRFNGIRATFVKPGFRRGSWGMIAAATITTTGSLIGGAGGSKGARGGKKDPYIIIEELADYPESETARKEMAGKLEEWGGQPEYGAISPDWGDIWERAKGKVGRYYWGGPGETGLAGKVRAGAARRGVSESPAMETLIGRMGQQEATQLGEMSTEQALQEALFGEKGKQDWFGQMQQLAGMKPSYVHMGVGGQTGATGGGTGEMLGDLGSSIGNAVQQRGQNKWMENYMDEMFGGRRNLGVADPKGGYGGYSGGAYSGPGYSGVGPVIV